MGGHDLSRGRVQGLVIQKWRVGRRALAQEPRNKSALLVADNHPGHPRHRGGHRPDPLGLDSLPLNLNALLDTLKFRA